MKVKLNTTLQINLNIIDGVKPTYSQCCVRSQWSKMTDRVVNDKRWNSIKISPLPFVRAHKTNIYSLTLYRNVGLVDSPVRHVAGSATRTYRNVYQCIVTSGNDESVSD